MILLTTGLQYAIILPMLDIPSSSVPADSAADAVSDNHVAPSPSILRAERQLRMLEELAEIGMELARGLGRRVAAEGVEAASDASCKAATPDRDPADAFQRLSRAVRLTLALEMHTDETLRALLAGEATAEAGNRCGAWSLTPSTPRSRRPRRWMTATRPWKSV